MSNEYTVPEQTRIGHVHLKVSNLQQSLDFYCGLLGFEISTRIIPSRAPAITVSPKRSTSTIPTATAWSSTGIVRKMRGRITKMDRSICNTRPMDVENLLDELSG